VKKNIAPVAGLVLLGTFAAGTFLASCTPDQNQNQNQNKTAQAIPTASPTDESILPSPSPEASPSPGAPPSAVVYHVVRNAEGVGHLERTGVPLKGDEEPAVTVLNHMADIKDSPLPKGTRAKSVMFGEDGTATVDFNAALKDNFEGGDEAEALMWNAILATVGQFPNVKQVQILVNGEKASIGGMQDTTQPMPVPPGIGTQVSAGSAGEGGGEPH